MSRLTSEQISSYRQKIRKLLGELDRLASRCLFKDPLIRGTPTEVFRTCGKRNCKCMADRNSRHGPYKVISVVRKGKQRPIPLKRNEEEIWKLAVHYQHQMKQLRQAKAVCNNLANIILEVIEKRLQEFPHDK
jgi:hypothetical protein